MSTHRKGASVSIVLILLLSCSHDWNNPVTRKENQKEEIPTQGLVAWYPFNGNARDESGSGFDGTAKGPILTSDRFGKANSAYLFDGVDDYIDTNYDFSWSVSDSFSLSLWFNPLNNSTNQVLIGKDGTQNWEYALCFESQRLWFNYWRPDAGADLSLSVESAIPDLNRWYHACIVYDGVARTGQLYIYGILKAIRTNIGSTYQDRSNSTQIGYGYYNSGIAHAFNGAIDDMRIYDRALTAAEVLALAHEGGYYAPLEKPVLSAAGSSDTAIRVQWKRVAEAESYSLAQSAARTGPFSQIYSGADSSFSHEGLNKNQTVWYRLKASNSHTASAWSDTISATASEVPTQGLVAWYPFNGNADDASGNGHNGSVVNAVLTEDRFSKTGKAYRFDGKSYIAVADDNDLDLLDNFTMTAWVYLNEFRRLGGVISKYNDQRAAGYTLRLSDDTPYDQIDFNNVTASVRLLLHQWYFIAARIESGAVTINYDTTAVTTMQLSWLIAGNGSVLTIGQDYSPEFRGFSGVIDEVRIYNRVLSDSELLLLYHQGGWGY